MTSHANHFSAKGTTRLCRAYSTRTSVTAPGENPGGERDRRCAKHKIRLPRPEQPSLSPTLTIPINFALGFMDDRKTAPSAKILPYVCVLGAAFDKIMGVIIKRTPGNNYIESRSTVDESSPPPATPPPSAHLSNAHPHSQHMGERETDERHACTPCTPVP